MQGNSSIYMGDDGNYHDKTPEQIAEEEKLAAAVPDGEPVPFDEEGKISGEAIVDPADGGDTEQAPDEESAPKARTRKQ